jgi:hypothetical protein
MRHTVELLMPLDVRPEDIVWQEPYTWRNGKPLHFQNRQAFVGKHKVTEGWVYVVRKCTLRVELE